MNTIADIFQPLGDEELLGRTWEYLDPHFFDFERSVRGYLKGRLSIREIEKAVRILGSFLVSVPEQVIEDKIDELFIAKDKAFWCTDKMYDLLKNLHSRV